MNQNDIFREVQTAPFGIQDAELGFNIIQRPDWYQVISSKHKVPSANEVIHSQVDPSMIDSVIDETLKQYSDIGTPFKWCVTPFTEPKNMAQLLTSKGFSQWSARGMYIFCDQSEALIDPNLRVDLLSMDNIDDFIETSHRGWSGGELSTDERRRLTEITSKNLEKKNVMSFLAYADGVPAGTGAMILKDNSVYLVSANVLKDHRGKGLYKALLSKRLAEAANLGFQLAVTHARENTSAPILEKIGFHTAYKYQVFQLGGILPE